MIKDSAKHAASLAAYDNYQQMKTHAETSSGKYYGCQVCEGKFKTWIGQNDIATKSKMILKSFFKADYIIIPLFKTFASYNVALPDQK